MRLAGRWRTLRQSWSPQRKEEQMSEVTQEPAPEPEVSEPEPAEPAEPAEPEEGGSEEE